MEITKKQLAEFKREYPYILENEIKLIAQERQMLSAIKRKLSTINEQNKTDYTRSLPKSISIDVNWHKSHTWGHNPSVDLQWFDDEGGHYKECCGRASGYGYDKESAAVAEALNRHFKNILWKARSKNWKNHPYGIRYSKGFMPYFEGGVGISCYYRIFEWLGYKMECVASGKTYDKYTIKK